MLRRLLCLLGVHNYKETGVKDKIFVDELSHSYEFKEKKVCTRCNKEEWV